MLAMDKYLNLITSEHQGQPKFTAWLMAAISMIEDAQNHLANVHTYFDIDTAIGAQLDVLGSILNVPRRLPFQPTPNPPSVRYIRDWANGNTVNTISHWVEIQAMQTGTGTNVALNKTVTANFTPSSGTLSMITDGNIQSANYTGSNATGPQNDVVDLGQAYEISSINVWHYYADGRTYHGTKTEVSVDGTVWTTIFDSAVSGEYSETPNGHTISLSPSPLMDDDTYRLVLKSAIARAHFDGTIPGFFDIIQNTLGNTGLHFEVQDNQDMTVNITAFGVTSSVIKDLIENGYIIPRPEGVNMVINVSTNKVFAWGIENEYFGGWGEGYWV